VVTIVIIVNTSTQTAPQSVTAQSQALTQSKITRASKTSTCTSNYELYSWLA